MNPRIFLGLALVSISVLFGCSTTKQTKNWPVFYDAEKGPDQLFISREPQTIDFYTNKIPEWNYDLRVPAAKIDSVVISNLGETDGLRVIEVRLALKDMYYTDVVMILEEVGSGRFLPVYVQDYNKYTRSPCESVINKQKQRLIVTAGMDYSGTGHFHDHYKITISPSHDPVVAGWFH